MNYKCVCAFCKTEIFAKEKKDLKQKKFYCTPFCKKQGDLLNVSSISQEIISNEPEIEKYFKYVCNNCKNEVVSKEDKDLKHKKFYCSPFCKNKGNLLNINSEFYQEESDEQEAINYFKYTCNCCENEVILKEKKDLKHKKFYCSPYCKKQGNSLNENLDISSLDSDQFAWFIRFAKIQSKNNTNLDTIFLKTIWENQQGKCYFSDEELLLPDCAVSGFSQISPNDAMLSLINFNQGYIKGNVRFISLIASLTKLNFSDQDVIAFCTSVSNKFKA